MKFVHKRQRCFGLNSEVGRGRYKGIGVGLTSLSASWSGFPVAQSQTAKSGEPAGWKAGPTLFAAVSPVRSFGIQAQPWWAEMQKIWCGSNGLG